MTEAPEESLNMVMRTMHCGPDDLRRLLDDDLADGERAPVLGHLDHCESCRRRMESLAAESAWWDDLPRFKETSEDPASPRTETVGGPSPRGSIVEDPPLDFLGPAETPESLGSFGPYDVLEVLGRGGMGVVLKARDPGLDRIVAIKVLAPQLAVGASARRRFQREARAAASVCHDHVVTIHAVDEARGLPYLVMSCVAGRSLQDRLDRDGPLEVKEVVRIAMQAAAGLAAAHAQGIVHRDVKPSNILLENGVERVKITDFGLAQVADDASVSQSGVVAGTPQYMAPEQARGEAVDHRADLFSLGSVMYVMCAGRPPFRAETPMAVLRRVIDDAPRPLREINPDVPDWLEAIVARLHAKDPDDRYETAAEVAALLGRQLARLQHASHRDLAPGRIVKRPAPRRRMRRRWAATAALAALAAGLGVAETSGVVQVGGWLAAVVRIVTPHGTLVVETDDPDVSVKVDGEDVVVSGVGPHEIRVRPGRHHLEAKGGGEPGRSEWFTITRGGRRVVRIGRDDEARPATGLAETSAKKGRSRERTKPDADDSREETSQSAEEAYRAGLRLLAAHDEAGSQAPLERALKLAPDDAFRLKVYRALLPAYTRLPDFEKKVEALDYIITKSESAPERSLSRTAMLSFVYQRGKVDALIRRYESRLKQEPDDRTALYVLSEVYERLKSDPKRGARIAERLAKRRRAAGEAVDVQAQAGLAAQYVKGGKPAEGARLFESIAELDPKLSAWHRKEAALAWLKAKQPAKALAAARASADSPPENRGALLEYFWRRALGDVFLQTGEPALAIPEYERALEKTDIAGYLADTRQKLAEAREKAGKAGPPR